MTSEQPTLERIQGVVDRRSVTETWVIDHRPDGWTAAYRIDEGSDHRLVVSELRVYPTDDYGKPGRWSQDPDLVPAGGVPARLVRTLPIQGAATSAREIIRAEQRARPGVEQQILTQWGFYGVAAEGAIPTGRRGHSDLFYAEVAERYSTLYEAGSTKPSVDLQDEMEAQNVTYSLDSVRGFVKEARRRGFLSDAPRGRPGGALTDEAQQVLEKARAVAEDARRMRTWITMRHPTAGGEARVTLAAFDIWQKKGWELVPGSEHEEQEP